MSGMGVYHICEKQLWPQVGFDNHLKYIHVNGSSLCEGCKKCAKVGKHYRTTKGRHVVVVGCVGREISPTIFIQVLSPDRVSYHMQFMWQGLGDKVHF